MRHIRGKKHGIPQADVAMPRGIFFKEIDFFGQKNNLAIAFDE